MKVDLKPTILNPKTLFTNVKKFFTAKTKPLENDAFEKRVDKPVKKIVSRKHPNWCDAPEDGYVNRTVAQRICYYPEDKKKMETMTKEEISKFKDKLDKEGRYYYDDNYHVDTPYLDKLIEEYGIDMSKFIVKD